MSGTLTDLAERVENGSGEDRELDAEIAIAVFGYEGKVPELVSGTILVSEGHVKSAPRLTSSLDAVTALIEEKLPGDVMAWHVGFSYNGGPYDARIFSVPDLDDQREVTAFAQSPARALLAAFLKAYGASKDIQ